MSTTYSRFAVVPLLCLASWFLPASAQAGVNVFLDYTNFSTRLGELGAGAFSSADQTAIRTGIMSVLSAAYADFSVSFSETAPLGLYETINFGLTAGAGNLGLADRIDYRNLVATDVARVFTGNFGFIIDEVGDRPTQISQLAAALGGTAAHELGHNLGLQHHDSYGDPALNPAATGGLQNTHIMATGSTGLDEAGREATRTFSTLELAKLEYAAGLTADPADPILEVGAAHGTAGTAQSLAKTSLAISGVNAFSVIGGISAGGENDFYSFVGTAGSLFTANTLSSALFGSVVDTILTLYKADGTTVIALNDDIHYGATFIGGSGGLQSTDSLNLNVVLPTTGTYYLAVTGFRGDTGNYELFGSLLGDTQAVPEPSSLVVFGFACLGLPWISRCRKKAFPATI